MIEKKEIKLSVPIVIKEGEGTETKIDTLSLRRPKMKDLRGISLPDLESNMDVQAKLIARLAGLDESVIDELDLVDMEAVGEAIQDFFTRLEASLSTGKIH